MDLDPIPLILFGLTYLFLAVGRLPGLALDRTGFALLGALAFLATGRMTLDEARAAIDPPTLVVLFGMMLLSAQYQLSGLYGAIGRRLARTADPRRLLAGVLVVSALLAAVLTNDVVCFALAPLLATTLLRAGVDPVPHLLALAIGTNLGSALTPIGNPQNILIAQSMGLAFLPFVAVALVPVALSLAFAAWFLGRGLPRAGPAAGIDAAAAAPEIQLDRREATKAIALTVVAIALFLSPVPAYLTACAVAGVVLTSRRMHTRTMLGLVDWQMLALFVALFTVTRGLELSGWTEAGRRALEAADLPLAAGSVLVPVVALAGNLVGNVPAVMLLLPFVPAEPATGWALALASTFAGNALIVGSIANLIVVEQAERLGIHIGFRRHLAVGLPVTLVSLALAIATLALLRAGPASLPDRAGDAEAVEQVLDDAGGQPPDQVAADVIDADRPPAAVDADLAVLDQLRVGERRDRHREDLVDLVRIGARLELTRDRADERHDPETGGRSDLVELAQAQHRRGHQADLLLALAQRGGPQVLAGLAAAAREGDLAAVVRQRLGAAGEHGPELAGVDVERHQHRGLARIGRRHSRGRRRSEPPADLVDPALPAGPFAHSVSIAGPAGRAIDRSTGSGAAGARGRISSTV